MNDFGSNIEINYVTVPLYIGFGQYRCKTSSRENRLSDHPGAGPKKWPRGEMLVFRTIHQHTVFLGSASGEEEPTPIA